MASASRYQQRGASATKEDVHHAISRLDAGIFPGAFCKILPDILGNDSEYCNIVHADGAGTKSSLAYLYWKITGDLGVWKGIAQDAVVMNTDDLLCVGACNDLIVSSTIGRNKHLIPGEVIKTIIEGTEEFLEQLRSFGINIQLAGGETADVGDLVRTIIVDSTITARLRRSDVISNQQIAPGDVIVGLSSSGKANYENTYNSGIGSNGLTSARHDLFHKKYKHLYPESYDDAVAKDLTYSGPYDLLSSSPVEGITIGQLALSPTRTYVPVVAAILREFRPYIHGMVHCSGGGQTKILNFIRNLHVVKNNLFDIPPVFRLIMQASQSPYREMYQVFNMGHRFEIYVPEQFAEKVITIAAGYGVEAKIVGHCEQYTGKKLTLVSPEGFIVYDYPKSL